ncbi:spore coat protein H [Butyrivibrio proteoclasticus]|uniref:Spore coat protein H n=1 Tax=Butyrivibrio proteoclasticus TaxID=43305 RepID=A0A1I5R214_9FIRM|nr:CotH kinase family protein [Butyrivibrio proteoclasticus]SFP52562.1 spore coat protein H [Butyrivibrio proteoclasticus]
MRKKKRKAIGIIFAFVVIAAAIAGSNLYNYYFNEDNQTQVETNTLLQAIDNININTSRNDNSHIRDVDALYEDDGTNVVTMYLTVRQGNAGEGTNHTWEEVNSHSAYYYDELGIPRYKVEALLQVGTEEGIPAGNLGYGRTAPNATVQIRGQTSSRNYQKNYKIKLKENQGNWNGQTTISLNKHQTDGLRFRNKLGFDILKNVDQLMSLRTQFVHLYVNDLTDGSDDGFEDYGLYTQVEQLNKTALRAHGLDRYGQLYKVNFFEFFRYEDVIKLETDPEYDVSKFEQYLEIKGDSDHTKLIDMLNDLNDYSISIDEVLDEHFDRENLAYWLAFNLLTGNVDTQSRNCYLYSPKNEKVWYFISWDLDGTFRTKENELLTRSDYGSWEKGVSNYWGNVLFNRCLKSDSFRKELDDAILDLKENVITPNRISELITDYRAVVEQYLWDAPDITYEQLTPEQYDEVALELPSQIEENYESYLASLEKPLPFYVGEPAIEDGKLLMNWDTAYDFQHDDVTYRAVLSRNSNGDDVVASYEGVWTKFSCDVPEPGEYFLSVNAIDENGNSQECFDYYEDAELGKTYGVLCFYINEDGTIDRYTVVE